MAINEYLAIDANIYPELHLFCSLKCNRLFLAFRPSWKLLSVPWLELKMSLLVENKSYPSWDGQTVRQFPAIHVMSSNSFLLCFIFTAQYLSLTKYFTACYPASYSAQISWSSVPNLIAVYSRYICRFHLSCLQVTYCKTPLTNILMMRLVLVYWSWYSWPWHSEHVHEPSSLLALTLLSWPSY